MTITHQLAWPLTTRNNIVAQISQLNDKMASILAVMSRADNEGVTTRYISDECDMSIYSARNWLIKLEEEGYVFHKKSGKRKAIWFITE